LELLQRLGGPEPESADLATDADLFRVHDHSYVEVVRRLSDGAPLDHEAIEMGFALGDNPAFPGMDQAARAYVGATVAAARDVCDGASLAFGLGGGLHHAHRAAASGFCIFNDAAIALHILRERFDRVAYVDIDVHHGDGVQAAFFDDPTVLTASIHESGRTLFPGTGFVEELGADGTSVNVPLDAWSTGDTWLWAFANGILEPVRQFRPRAIVIQMGTDAHVFDPLAHLRVTAQEWLHAVVQVRDLGLPIVAVGGGGYNLTTVPRMWVAATLTLLGLPFDDRVPEDLAARWQMPLMFDDELPEPRRCGMESAEQAVEKRRLLLAQGPA
jgi:acetoin utilization protein AcuC